MLTRLTNLKGVISINTIFMSNSWRQDWSLALRALSVLIEKKDAGRI